MSKQLLAILEEARQIAEDERNTPPMACPKDGEPLERGPGGTLHCPFCGRSYPANN